MLTFEKLKFKVTRDFIPFIPPFPLTLEQEELSIAAIQEGTDEDEEEQEEEGSEGQDEGQSKRKGKAKPKSKRRSRGPGKSDQDKIAGTVSS